MENQHIPSLKISSEVTVNPVVKAEGFDKFHHPHRLELSSLLIVTKGHAELTINLFHFTVKRNDIIVVLFGSIVQLTECSEDLEVEIIAFSPEFVKDIDLIKSILPYWETVRSHAILTVAEEDIPLIMEFYSLFSKVYQRMEQNSVETSQVIRHLLISFFHSILAIYNQGKAQSNAKALSRQEEITRNLLSLVVKNYREERSIRFYADKLNITPTYLSMTVRKVMNKSISDIISEAVILDAKAQLKSSNLTIQEISDSLNFADQSFFGKYFKRHTGLSPKNYRENPFRFPSGETKTKN